MPLTCQRERRVGRRAGQAWSQPHISRATSERWRRAREEAAAAVEDERRRREREEAAVAAAAMAAELMQTPPSQGPRPRRHFVEEAECSDLDSGSDDRSGSDVDGLIDDGPRVETPLGDRLRRHLDLERSGNPAARRRSRVGGWEARVATLMGTLLPAAGAVPKFAQLYTLGGGEEEVALDRRVGLVMQWFSKKMGKDARRSTEVTLRFLITELTARLRRDNPYVRDFVTAAESIRAAEERGESGRGVRVRVDAGRAPPGAAARTYIGDGRSEVYMVMPDDIGSGEFGGFELKLRPGLKEGNPLRQMEGNTMGGFYALHRAADPTHFVLLFPDGRDGWHRQVGGADGADQYLEWTGVPG